MYKLVTIELKEKVFEKLKELADRNNLSLDQIIEIALDLRPEILEELKENNQIVH